MAALTAKSIRQEQHLRSALGLLLLIVLPPFIALLVRAKMTGLAEPLAVDHAQLARHLADGDGFVTSVLRPLSLAKIPRIPHPDLVNAPAHPLLLACVYRVLGAGDGTTAAAGAVLWVGSVWLTFLITRSWFGGRAGGVAAAFYACSLVPVTLATGGLPYVLAAVALLIGFWAAIPPRPRDEGVGTQELWRPLLAGVACGIAGLTDYVTMPVAIVIAGLLARSASRKWTVVGVFAAALGLLWVPWVTRNILVADGRVLGLFSYQVLTGTAEFPGESIWRTMAAPAHPLFHLLAHPLMFVRKLFSGVVREHGAVIGVFDPVVLFLAGIALVASPNGSRRHRLAGSAGAALLGSGLLSCLWASDPHGLAVWTPILAVAAAAQLVSWMDERVTGFRFGEWRWPVRGRPVGSLRLSASLSHLLVYAGLTVLVAFPLVCFGLRRGDASKDRAAQFGAIQPLLPQTGLVMTDLATDMAWYGQRPALLFCQSERDLDRIESIGGPLVCLYASPSLGTLPPPEVPDWWIWPATPRGVYRGLGPVQCHAPGTLRTPVVDAADKEAADEIPSAAAEGRDTSEAQASHGLQQLRHGRLREADQAFREAIRLDPYNVEAYIGWWQTRAQLTQPAGTLQLSQLVTQISPRAPQAQALLGQAAAYFDQALTQAADPWLLLNALACRVKLQQWNELERYYAQLAGALPKTFPAQLLLANLYFQQGQLDRAGSACEGLVREQPTIPTAHHLLARVRLAQGRYEEALSEAVATTRLRPRWFSAHLLAGRACHELKRYADAIQHYRTALTIAPGHIPTKLSLADACLALNQTAEAAAQYREILQQSSAHPIALNNLVLLLIRSGQVDEAVVTARRAVTLYPESAIIRDTAGWACFLAGAPGEARTHLMEAVRLDGKMSMAYYHLAKLQLASGENEAARRNVQVALTLGLPDLERTEANQLVTSSAGTPPQGRQLP